jgi:L-iditol 2-dehydrogenase
MKAFQITKPREFQIIDIPKAEPLADEVVVEVKAINSCTHWDLTVWDGVDIFGREGYPEYPHYIGRPGHELSGEVVEIGDSVTALKVGDHVAVWGSRPGTQRLRKDTNYRPTGGYVQYFTCHEGSVLPFPQGALPWREMAMLEMLSCVAQAVVRVGEVQWQRVAVTGLGPAGLMALQALKSRGPDEITAIDLDPARCEMAESLGADRSVRPGTKEWDALRPDEFTIVVDCSGVPAAIEGVLEHTSGRLVIFSVPEGPFRITQADRRKRNTVEYSGTPQGRPGPYARQLLVSGAVKVKPFLSVEIPIEQFEHGIDLLRSRKAIKVSYDMWK